MTFRRLLSHLLLIFTFALCSFRVFAATDPSIDWKMMSTKHFDIIFDAKQRELAIAYARYSEVAYRDLEPLFKEMPSKVTVWINNSTDISNGFAMGFPYPQIVIYPTLPNVGQSIGEFDDWGQELMTHELTHILQFQPVHGFMGFLRNIFGSIIVPNGLLPRWWLEGMAVEIETQLSHGGRLRSLRQQSLLRALTLGDALYKEDIARANETSIPDWLGGERPYLLGSLVWNELVNEKGNESIHHLNQAHSRRVPFWKINTPVEDYFQANYQGVLNKAYRRVRKESQAQIDKIRKRGSKKTKSLKRDEEIHRSPILSPDGSVLAFASHSVNRKTQVITMSRGSSNSFQDGEKTFHNFSPSNRMSWGPLSKKIYFDKIDTHDRYYSISDIYSYDVDKKEVKQITKGLRARDAAASLNGQNLAFIQLNGQSTQLVQTDIKGKNLKILYKAEEGQRISSPSYLSHSKIVFTQKFKDGKERLRVLNLESGKVKTALDNFTPIYQPRPSKKGLIFVSGKTGVYNAYLANASLTQAKAITNTELAIHSAEWDNKSNELIVGQLSTSGKEVSFVKGITETNPPLISSSYKRNSYEKKNIDVEIESESDYSPWSYLIPRYWMPYVLLTEEGLFLQASTSSNDPLGKHAYSVLGAYDTGTEKFNWSASYTNQTTPIRTRISGYDFYDFFGSSTLLRRQSLASIFGTSFVPGLSNNWRWGAGWRSLQTEISSLNSKRQGPAVTLVYSNLSRRGKQIAPENSGSAALTLTDYIESLGDVGFFRARLNTSYYYSPSWFKSHHVLSAKLRGVYSSDQDNNFFGLSTSNGYYQNQIVSDPLLMRGYYSGNFIAQNAANASLEYIFPLRYIYSGSGTAPIFTRSLHGRIVADVITLDGIFYDDDSEVFRTTDFGEFYSGAGAELHWSTTIGYHLPLTLFYGLYYGLNDEASGGFYSFIGASM